MVARRPAKGSTLMCSGSMKTLERAETEEEKKAKKLSTDWLRNTGNTRETTQGHSDFLLQQIRKTLVCVFSNLNLITLIHSFSGQELNDSTLQLVQIFFDTASFDEIERDVEIKIENQISLIGGTMGLFTGFSIISGIEMVYFAIKIFFSSTKKRKKSV